MDYLKEDIMDEFEAFEGIECEDDTLPEFGYDDREARIENLFGANPCDIVPDSFRAEWVAYMDENADNF